MIAGKAADVLNLVSVILIAVALSQYIIGSIATFADALNGITMFGSGGGIQAVITMNWRHMCRRMTDRKC